MEGPSIVIAKEELKPFLKRKILKAAGTAAIPFATITNGSLIKTDSWGKHLILIFSNVTLRTYFLMFEKLSN